ncbi:MAG: glycosyltransferase family 2 protein [Chloroflexi bacterium]|nr:glycosyltransferase family 2 protein [Chloroflexota bacterium]
MAAILFWLCAFLIIYTYAGYPLALALLARLKARPAPYPKSAPPVSLIIAAYNEEDVIEKKLENCLALAYPPGFLQIIVAADGSDDRTVEIVRCWIENNQSRPGFPSVLLNDLPQRQGKMAAITRAVPLASGDILVFSDANNFYQPDTLMELVAPFREASVGGVSGAKHILQEGDALAQSEGLYWKYESRIKAWEARLSSCTIASGEILAMRKTLYSPPPAGIINDDFYFAMHIIRQGFHLEYAPTARSFETVSKTARDEMLRRERIVAGRYQAIALAPSLLPWRSPLVVWQVVSHKFLRPLVPFAMLGLFLSNLFLLLFPAPPPWNVWALSAPLNLLCFGGQVLFYLLAWLGSSVKLKGKVGKLLYLPTFLVHSNFAAVSGALRYLRRQQTTSWTRVQRRT